MFNISRLKHAAYMVLAFLVLSGCASLKYGDDQFQLVVGTHGKDVMWVPTKTEIVHHMLKAAAVTKDDLLYDLGSGDGIIPIEAARALGVRAHGIEYNKDLVDLSIRNAKRAGVSHLTSFKQGDIFRENFSDATVVTLYLGENLNIKLKPILLSMKPGTRIVSNTFRMGSWEPDGEFRSSNGEAGFLWIVPVNLEGTWELKNSTAPNSQTVRLVLRQSKQLLRGTLIQATGKQLTIESGRIRGDTLNVNLMDSTGKTSQLQGAFRDNVLVLHHEDQKLVFSRMASLR